MHNFARYNLVDFVCAYAQKEFLWVTHSAINLLQVIRMQLGLFTDYL